MKNISNSQVKVGEKKNEPAPMEAESVPVQAPAVTIMNGQSVQESTLSEDQDQLTAEAVSDGIRSPLREIEESILSLMKECEVARNERDRTKQDAINTTRKLLCDLFCTLDQLDTIVQEGEMKYQKNDACAWFVWKFKHLRALFDLVFLQNQIEKISVNIGDPFHEAFHKVEGREPTPGVHENAIIRVHQPGYMKDGVVLRPVTVDVAEHMQEE